MTGLMETLDPAALRSSGHKPTAVASAPGRCGLVGNPTDMYGGSVISCSTRERATCSLYTDTDQIVITVSGQSQAITSAADLELRDGDYLNVVRAVLLALEVDPRHAQPFHLEATTSIPVQAGLAGSTAILATVVGCVLELMKFRLNSYEIAELVRKIESDVLGIVCGFQDHYMATFGGLNYLDFRDKFSSDPQDSTTPFATVEPLSNHVADVPILLAHTGVKHHSGVVHKSIRDRWMEGEPAVVDGYVEIARLARGAKKALLACDWDALGDLMNRNHDIQRKLGGSGPANEALISAAINAGAIGAKLAGAGGGGTIIALTTEPQAMADALMAAGADRIMYPESSPGLTVEVPA